MHDQSIPDLRTGSRNHPDRPVFVRTGGKINHPAYVARFCAACDRMLVHVYALRGRIEIRCQTCRSYNVIVGSDSDATLAIADREHRRKADRVRPRPPTPEEILAVMEARWETHRIGRAKRSADVAVGLRFDVFKRDGFRCRYCGVSVEQGALLHADHVVARSKGGPDTLDNLVTACVECNLGKSDKTL